MEHAGRESQETGRFLFCNANASLLVLVKLNSNWVAVSLLSAAMERDGKVKR